MNIHKIESLEDHDELMCLLQLVPHLILRLVANIFADLGTDLNLLSSAATANFKLFYLSLWRVLVQSPDLSAAIIGRLMDQPRGREIYHRFAASLSNVPLSDIDTLTSLFRGFYDTTSPSEPYMEKMNMQGIVTLERLANLETVSIIPVGLGLPVETIVSFDRSSPLSLIERLRIVGALQAASAGLPSTRGTTSALTAGAFCGGWVGMVPVARSFCENPETNGPGSPVS